jgi:DNA polymerase III alpha subunit
VAEGAPPAEFMAANMSLVMDDTDKVKALLRRRARKKNFG